MDCLWIPYGLTVNCLLVIFHYLLKYMCFSLLVMDAERDEYAGYLRLHFFEISRLIIKEDMGADSFQDAAFVESVKQEEFCRAHAKAF